MSDNTPLQTTIYENLRQQLYEGEIEAGSSLSEQQLADRFEASRMPVRQALARLAHEGLIEQSSRVRSAIVRPTLADLQETIELRALLEPHAASLAARQIQWPALEKLDHAASEMEAVAKRVAATKRFTDHDRQAELYADLSFHRTLWEAAQRPRLARMCDDLHLLWRIGAPIQSDSDATPLAVLKQASGFHNLILKAIKASDSHAAADAMHQHVMSNNASLTRIARQLTP